MFVCASEFQNSRILKSPSCHLVKDLRTPKSRSLVCVVLLKTPKPQNLKVLKSSFLCCVEASKSQNPRIPSSSCFVVFLFDFQNFRAPEILDSSQVFRTGTSKPQSPEASFCVGLRIPSFPLFCLEILETQNPEVVFSKVV